MKLNYISWIPAIIVMTIIYMFSAKPVTSSNESSMIIANSVLNLYESITNQPMQDELRPEKLEIVNHIIRKTAHFMEYAVLAVTIVFHLWVWKMKYKWIFLFSSLFSALYAATDEFHQTFVPGRGGQFKDVILDSCGALTGALLSCVLIIMIEGRKKRKEQKVRL